MRHCHIIRYDSFRSVRNDIGHLFSPFKDAKSLQEAMRRHIIKVPSRYADTPRQRMSWFRGSISLILSEAARRGSHAVSRATMELLVEQSEQLQLRVVDPMWVKNAFATCTNADEMRVIEQIIQKFHDKQCTDGETKRGLSQQHQKDGAPLPPALSNSTGGFDSAEGSVSLLGDYSGFALESLSRQRVSSVTAPNTSFSRYFIRQGLVADEAELMELFRAMIGRRPAAFRVHTSQMYGAATAEIISGRPGIEPLHWLPKECAAFVMHDSPNVPHSVLLANRQLLHTLASEHLISFQSTSSMLPVLLLDPRPGDAVLDLCASPGNKTSLVLDYVSSLRSTSLPSSNPHFHHGCIVANDVSPPRSRQLAQRLRNSSPTVAVTQFHGQSLPLETGASGGNKYNKILVDAPCSGEGRMQRDAMSWRMWHPLRGLQFMQTQLRLLRRAVNLCSVGGHIVYSTCTLNPLEDEAVIAAVLRDGAVELVEPPRELREKSGWRFSRGLRRWVVPSRAGGFLNTLAEAEAKGEGNPTTLTDLFPYEGNEKIQSALESCCLRVMPHCNGGAEGFFVALLRKLPVNLNQLSPTNHASRYGTVKVEGTEDPVRGNSSTGALTCGSVLHTYGVAKLAAGNMLLQRLLGGFFSNNTCQLEFFFSKCNLCAAWKEGHGLIILSNATWSHLDATPSSFCSKSELLELGTTVIEAETGNLTAVGAYLLRPYATSRVLKLPLLQLQWLLSNQVLKINEHQMDPTVLARRLVAGVGGTSSDINMQQHQLTVPWVRDIMNVVGKQEGNFIVCYSPSSGDVCDSGSFHKSNDACGLLSISIPVIVRRTPSVELHLSLFHDARQLCRAVIGRVLSHRKRADSPDGEKSALQLGSRFNVSATLGITDLEGRRLTPQGQKRKLYSPNLSIYPVTGSGMVASTAIEGNSEGDRTKEKDYFIL
ncbi:hypothetical protein, conserved [Trypanosoma brucei brucei TREU927]|uniref:SAM-dependent MTase RsmB/NOP-type domain-containing protein n=1 Tax=Trypanosoma brucei brucei (strain 927/4 GUTat10.1) TaxID=185431 RepID=Q582C3_TRYB2|nr:hypothetical protein, conserved [Trypanosoma brucei brucei TREU927]AAX80446.1 hypothetical protein, conserved [Trypanosoma brucei]AAZ11357.1 hypothetical protein, conserved [Trypanosoma brucei brucei TREU927]